MNKKVSEWWLEAVSVSEAIFTARTSVQLIQSFLAPNPKGLGAYNWGSARHMPICISLCMYIHTYVRTFVDRDFSEVYGSNSLKLYAKIRYV